jgi:hypothetical protein
VLNLPVAEITSKRAAIAKVMRRGTTVRASTPRTSTARVSTADEAQPMVATARGVHGFTKTST